MVKNLRTHRWSPFARDQVYLKNSLLLLLPQNGVVEKKNRVIQEMARAMLHNKDVAQNLWGEAVNIACHMVNRMYFRLGTKKTPCEIWKGRKPNVKYFRILEVLVSFSRIERM